MIVGRETVAQVWTRLEVLHLAQPSGVFATDGDGTLWSGDVGEDFLHALLAHDDVRAPARDALLALAEQFGVQHASPEPLAAGGRASPEPLAAGGRASPEPVIVAKAIFEAYVAHVVPEDLVCEMIAWLTAGWSRAEVYAFCREVVRETALATRLHAETTALLQRARAAGLEVFAVSASPRPIVEVACELVGIDPAHVVAVTPHYDASDVMIASVERPIPYARGKVDSLRLRIGDRPLLAACGDNAFDVDLLREAHIGLGVRPKERLLARWHEVPGLVALDL